MENIDIMIILAQAANFLILFLLFKKFIAWPLHETIQKRRALLAKIASADEEYAKIVEMATSQRTEILVQARKDAQKLLRDMEDISKLKWDEIVLKAQKKAKTIIESGKREVEKEKIFMINEMKDKILELTLQLNEKILGTQDTKNKKFLKKELDLLV